MAFFCLPEDIQRVVIQTWILPENADSSALLKLWSNLDIACSSHGLRPLLSAFPQVGKFGDALLVRDVVGFCTWISGRGWPLTLPSVKTVAHSSSLDAPCVHVLSQLCPNLATIVSSSGVFSDEVLDHQ